MLAAPAAIALNSCRRVPICCTSLFITAFFTWLQHNGVNKLNKLIAYEYRCQGH